MQDFFSALGNLFGFNFTGGSSGAPSTPTKADAAQAQLLSFLPNGGRYTPPQEKTPVYEMPYDIGEAVMAPFRESSTIFSPPKVPPPQTLGLQAAAVRDHSPRVSSMLPQEAAQPPVPVRELDGRPVMSLDTVIRDPETGNLLRMDGLMDPNDRRHITTLTPVPVDTEVRPVPLEGTSPRMTSNTPNSADLGVVSAKYESGGRGVGFISSGKDDPGGRSYGIHQLSSAYSMGAFLRSPEGAAYRAKFGNTRPTTAAFNSIYREIAAAEPDKFAAAQRAFYTRTHFEPLKAHAARLGFDVNNRGVQEALFSMSVQHGKAKLIVSRAAGAGKGTAQDQIQALYAARSKYVQGLSSLKPNIKTSVLNRYRNELKDALKFST